MRESEAGGRHSWKSTAREIHGECLKITGKGKLMRIQFDAICHSFKYTCVLMIVSLEYHFIHLHM